MPWPPFTRRQKGWTTSSLRTPSLGGAGGAGRTGMFCSSANPPHPGLVRVGALLEHGRLDAGDPDDVMEEVDQVLWTLQPLDVAGANVLVLPLIATTCRVQPRLSPGSWLGQAQARSEGANQVFRHVVPLPTRRQVAAISMHTWDPRGWCDQRGRIPRRATRRRVWLLGVPAGATLMVPSTSSTADFTAPSSSTPCSRSGCNTSSSALAPQVRLHQPALMNQQRRGPNKQPPRDPRMEPERAGRAVQQQEDDRREQPGAERGVGTPIAFCTALLMISSSTTLVGPGGVAGAQRP